MADLGCLFETTNKNGNQIELDLRFPSHSFWFDGHFPDNPIVPGIAFLCFVKNRIIASFPLPSNSIVNVISTRFKKIVKPEVPLCVKLNMLADSEANFKISEKLSGQIVVTGKLKIVF